MNMNGARVQLVLSESGLAHLVAAGIAPGWLKAWLFSAGAHTVDLCMLEQQAWKRAADWYVFFAAESELMRVALHFGKRMHAGEGGRCGLLGVPSFVLDNPQREAWYFSNNPGPSRVLLLPLGDIAYGRSVWLKYLNNAQPLLPMHVRLDDADSCALEVGVSCSFENPEAGALLFNDGGYLPEESLMQALKARGLKVRFAESCTAGGMAERLSRLPGSSEVLDAAWVTYSNSAKQQLLGVSKRLIEKHGAVSREVVEAMAKGGSDKQHACIAVSGIAGPGGGSEDKPLGTVWIALALPGEKIHAECFCFPGSRALVRSQTVVRAFYLLVRRLMDKR
ncbi:MAG: CinA family protein [Mariprofundaceae bacterium]